MNGSPRSTSAIAAVLLACATLPASGTEPLQPEFRLANFSEPLRIDNPLLPMKADTYVVHYESEDGECAVNDVIVTRHAKRDFVGIYAGLAARVVRDLVYLDEECTGERGPLLEATSDWFAQDDGGNVWYLGEDTVEFEYDDEGNRIGSSREGSWEAGRDGKAGIVMFARPEVGKYYRQENSPGEAEDEARVVAVNLRVSTRLGHFRDCVKIRESTPLEPGIHEYKDYCRNIGLVRIIGPVTGSSAQAVKLGVR